MMRGRGAVDATLSCSTLETSAAVHGVPMLLRSSVAVPYEGFLGTGELVALNSLGRES